MIGGNKEIYACLQNNTFVLVLFQVYGILTLQQRHLCSPVNEIQHQPTHQACQKHILKKHTTNDVMSQSQNSHNSTTARSPDIPQIQWGITDDFFCMCDDNTYADATREIAPLWNEWADDVENILHRMIDQMEQLSISYDDYLTLVAHLATYPARPALPSTAPQSHEDSNRRLIDAWNAWADVVESIANDMTRAIVHSVPLPREQQMLGAGGPFDFSLDLSKQDPPPMHVAAHMREMLRDGTVAREGLADLMEDLCI